MCWHGFCNVSVTLCSVNVTLSKWIFNVFRRSDSKISQNWPRQIRLHMYVVRVKTERERRKGTINYSYWTYCSWYIYSWCECCVEWCQLQEQKLRYRGGQSVLTPPPSLWKITKSKVSRQYWAWSPETSQIYQASNWWTMLGHHQPASETSFSDVLQIGHHWPHLVVLGSVLPLSTKESGEETSLTNIYKHNDLFQDDKGLYLLIFSWIWIFGSRGLWDMDDKSLYLACECFKTDKRAEQDLIRLKIIEHLILVCSVCCKYAIY